MSIPTRPATFKPGQIATVIATEGLRMRTKPSTASGSLRYTPLLPKGTDLYVISGPTHGSGYHWYQVASISFGVHSLVKLPRSEAYSAAGWVAAASRDGEPWLGHRKVTCPPKPRDVAALAALWDLEALACFSRVPITVQARILDCNCSDTGPCDVFKPAWFFLTGGYLMIFPPATRPDDVNTGQQQPGLGLVVDPKGRHPDPIPLDKVVTVTGMFNHPAAAGCQKDLFSFTDGKPVWVPSGYCRSIFAVTSIR